MTRAGLRTSRGTGCQPSERFTLSARFDDDDEDDNDSNDCNDEDVDGHRAPAIRNVYTQCQVCAIDLCNRDNDANNQRTCA